MTKRDFRGLLDWIRENKRIMEVTGAFNITLVVENRIMNELSAYHGQDIAHFRGGNYGSHAVQLQGMDVQCRPTPTGAATNAMEAVILQAQGMNLTRGDIKPVMKASTCWPVRKNAEAMRECMAQVREWCERKESFWFQRSDVIRLSGCTRHMASEALEYLKETGDIRNDGRWWHFGQIYRGTPRSGVNKFQMGVDLAAQGSISMQAAASSLGIDYDKELKALRQEQEFRKLYQQTPVIPRSR